MEKLDFSGISTERLRKSVEAYYDGDYYTCKYHSCDFDECPFNDGNCLKTSTKDQHILFKEELNRREKDMNEIPELKAGMIIEFSVSPSDKMLYINDKWLMSLKNSGWASFDGGITRKDISKIYECVNYIKGYNACSKNPKLIWSRKSDKDIEIEEIQKEMDKLNKRMESLKG